MLKFEGKSRTECENIEYAENVENAPAMQMLYFE